MLRPEIIECYSGQCSNPNCSLCPTLPPCVIPNCPVHHKEKPVKIVLSMKNHQLTKLSTKMLKTLYVTKAITQYPWKLSPEPKKQALEEFRDEEYGKVFDAWDIPTIRLPQEAAEFYLLEYLSSVEEYEPAKQAMLEKTDKLAGLFSRYLNMVVGGEFRHLVRYTTVDWNSLDPIIRNIYPTPKRDGNQAVIPRGAAWLSWKALFDEHGTDIIEVVYRCFQNEYYSIQWNGGFGGKAWAGIAELLLRFLRGKISAKLFVDRIWSIQHNGGTVFDKCNRMLGLGVLKDVLDAQRAGSIDTLALASGSTVLKIYTDWMRDNAS